ncbi:hypothetical protein KJZ71_03430 [Patescibacteria group bacterium]|nr:hypothetical protein [Patescibacteria group bacterium]MDL1953005.1 hypothetical protein [Candidatus Uhrbacteria bacterium UHB]RIL00208.1 MAG: hypothetical protein DCC77_04970 [Candidatus Uhrbacteria bacterium]
MIKKRNGKWVVLSEHTGRSFGSYGTKTEAKKRLKQVEFFKHLKSIPKSKMKKKAYKKRAS